MSSQSRHQKGTPKGGRYAPGAHDETGVALAEPPPAGEDPIVIAYMEEHQHIELDDHELLRRSGVEGRRIARKTPTADGEDLAQEIAAYHYNAAQNAKETVREAVLNGEVATNISVLENPVAYLHRVAHGIGQREATGFSQNPDRSAIKAWREGIRKIEQDRGSAMSQQEKDALAEQIREGQPSGRRATEGFHLPQSIRTVRMSDDGSMPSLEEAANAVGARESDGASNSNDYGEDELAYSIMTDLDESRAGAVQRARRDAADAIAPAYGAPKIARASLSESKSAATRRTVEQAGGIAEIASAWSNETSTSEQDDALFAPYGADLSFDERSSVAAMFSSIGDHSDAVFDGAISGATRRRSK